MASPLVQLGGPLEEGTLLAGKYRIGRVLGAGGMCIVYEAEHIHLRQPIALKILKPELAKDATAVARFEREAQAAAQLRSPNVARVFDVDKLPDGQPYITMELLVGHDLGTELSHRYALPVDLAVDFIRQVASGISEAHALGIVHRDLKPENLFLSDLGTRTDRKLVKILDFGIAKHVHDGARKLTAPDAVFGTVDYMSPEQIRSSSTVDHRTDIWSLGVILFELLTGRPPFLGDARSVIAQIVSEPVPAPSRFVPTLPHELVLVVMKALAKEPNARFQSAEQLERALAPFAKNVEPITDVLARLPPESVPRRSFSTSRVSGSVRDVRTNLSFEASSTRTAWAKRAFALPLFAALGALAGLGVWKHNDMQLRQPSAESALASPAGGAMEFPDEPRTPTTPATLGTAAPTVIGVSTPLDQTPAGESPATKEPLTARVSGGSAFTSSASTPPPPFTSTAARKSTPKVKPRAPSTRPLSSPAPAEPTAASEPAPEPAPATTSPALPKHL